MCCAPVLFRILLERPGPEAQQQPRCHVEVLTGGVPPPAALLERVERMGFRVTHAYGLTEATGPALACEWRAEWDRLPAAERAALKARQGVSALSLADVDVKNAETMRSVPRDGRSVGEIVLRGSNIMKGYLKNPAVNAEAFGQGAGWFFTGNVGVVHPDGYVEIRDRSKDVIISGGENISSVEVEAVLYRHPAVAEAAVVAMPHLLWGETPWAFIVPREGPVSQTRRSSSPTVGPTCRISWCPRRWCSSTACRRPPREDTEERAHERGKEFKNNIFAYDHSNFHLGRSLDFMIGA
uniref:AMP-dependent synthetase/ligase domain-containing protein n=1 Tax=Ananas comosus var. bracteatus TaxID=296719 RepID=A0A6V7PUE7_ANACO|nr:unnamed protein product [Ananas comosus var. bracteatus]